MKTEEFKNIHELHQNHFWYRHKKRIIREYCEKNALNPSYVLDMGCGVCADMDIFDNAVGADIDMNALNMCGNDKMIVNTDSMNAGIRDGSFSLIMSMDVMQHRGVDEAKFLREIHRILMHNGTFIINVPSAAIPYSAHDRAVANAKRYSKGQLYSLLSEYFIVTDITCWNALLFPAVLIRRLSMNIMHSGESISDFGRMPPLLERIFDMMLRFEIILSRTFNLPFGVSLFAVCRKTD